MVKTKTAEGMVPNFWQPGGISYDRTEPIVASKVLLEMFKKHKDAWIVELLFGDLYDWIEWFFRRRTEPPLDLIVLGSDPGLPTTDTPNMQAARYESGLDNSPMCVEIAIYWCTHAPSGGTSPFSHLHSTSPSLTRSFTTTHPHDCSQSTPACH